MGRLYQCDGINECTIGNAGEPNEVVEDWSMNVNCDQQKNDYGRRVDKDEDNSSNNLWESLFYKMTTTTSSTTPSSSPDHPDDIPRYARSSFLKNVRVLLGTFHRLKIDVPWSALASRPIVVRIKGIHVVLDHLKKKEERAVTLNEQQTTPDASTYPHQSSNNLSYSAKSCFSSSNVSLSGVSHMSNSTNNNKKPQQQRHQLC